MIFVGTLKRFLSLAMFFGLTSQALAAPSYDFFKDSAERIDEAAVILKKSPTDAANMVLFLENLRDSYYTHLDRIEAALPYWEWAKHHPYRYTASQFPHKWFTHEKNKAEIEKIHAMISAVREVYSKEFGIIVRLLAMRQEDALDDATWLAEVKKGVATILMTPLEDLGSTELIIQKLSDHEQDVAKMVEKVQSPNWLKRHWRSLLATTLIAGCAAYYYMNNQQMVHDGFASTIESLKINVWQKFFGQPAKELKNEIENILKKPEYSNNSGDNTSPQEISTQKYLTYLKEDNDSKLKINEQPVSTDLTIDKALTMARQGRLEALAEFDGGDATAEPSYWAGFIPGHSYALQKKNAFHKILASLDLEAQAYENKISQLLNKVVLYDKEVNKQWQANKLNFIVFASIPACAFMYVAYRGCARLFNWFTTKDKSVLVGRLNQVEEVLIYSKHKVELADAEYGRLLYLLTKAHDQVTKNVPSNERIAFLKDLTYIANAQSSIEQKQKMIDSMWRKYRSLEKPA
jgi:hypothetical protein